MTPRSDSGYEPASAASQDQDRTDNLERLKGPGYRRVLLKLGGEMFGGGEVGLDPDVVHQVARQIAADFAGRSVTVVGVLTGSLIFLADLVRGLDMPVKIGLIQASSYRGASTTPGALRVQPEANTTQAKANK